MKDTIYLFDCDVYTEGKDTRMIASYLPEDVKRKTFEVRKNEFPENFDNCLGVIVSGSSHSAYDDVDWIKKLVEVTRGIIKQDIPFLGVCFGHQILGLAAGCDVVKGKYNVGVKNVKVKTDLLFEGLGNEFKTMFTHVDVVQPNDDIEVLSMLGDILTAMKVKGTKVYGIQFHPEMDEDFIKWLLGIREQKIKEYGLDHGQLMKDAENYENRCNVIFRNFVKVART